MKRGKWDTVIISRIKNETNKYLVEHEISTSLIIFKDLNFQSSIKLIQEKKFNKTISEKKQLNYLIIIYINNNNFS